MSVNLITGNLFSPIQASQDSDYQAGTFGEKTQILNVGSKMAVSIVDNSTIRCEDGVLVTKEGRRVQIDNGDVVEWTIPTGTQGTTSYYIVGFRLYTDDESAQLCDTFVQSVSGPGATITENTFRDGAVEIFVSVARVVQNGITLESIESLVSVATTLDQAKEAISRINSDLTDLTTLLDKTCTFTNMDSSSRYRCNIVPISKNLGLCVLKAVLVPTATTITYTIPKSTYGADINAVMFGLGNAQNVAILVGRNGTAGEMFTGTRTGLTANAVYVIDSCYLVAI